MIISTVVGDTNKAFYHRLKQEGSRPQTRYPLSPSASPRTSCVSFRSRTWSATTTAWDYFQSIDREENHQFIKRFKDEFGQDRVTSDVIVAAYDRVNSRRKRSRKSGPMRTDEVRKAMRRQSLDAAEGIISVDLETQHTWRPVYIGRVRGDSR